MTVGETGVGEMGVGETGQIIGETGVGETGVGEMGVIHLGRHIDIKSIKLFDCLQCLSFPSMFENDNWID